MIPLAKKSLGQNFLTDKPMIGKIMEAVSPKKESIILEIGPGRGALTLPLLESGCRLSCIELDRVLAEHWRSREALYPGFRCIEGDAVKLDWSPYLPCDICVGNIPYHISRPLMYKFFSYRRAIKEAVIMVQKEFAEKLLASPGDKAYGIVSVLTQCFCDPRYLFSVPPSVFSPPPKVTSACVRLTFKRTDTENDALLIRLVQTAFAQRRKVLTNSLKEFYDKDANDRELWLKRADGLRPEEYLALTREIAARS
ncbi:MAG: ribosomal RNA small subunit methyltransferase A [Candidatus Marinimicrobia bacterium]|nr:ribosomal RNA small subunit methyltransferase A [Candidatus Neomarinimicrobiota bacterium]